MPILYVTSLGEGEGKTMFSLGLGRLWPGKGVGYLRVDGREEDLQFARRVLNQETFNPSLAQLRQTLAQLQEKELVMVEASGPQTWQELQGLGAKALLLGFYPTHQLEEVVSAAQGFGEDLAGVVINAVPRSRTGADPWLQGLRERGIGVLGMLSEDRTLLAPSVKELTQYLGGSTLNHQEGVEELVEEILVGVYSLDPAPLYYQRKTRKTAIIRGDRPDMQLGALETPTRCLILTGGVAPNHYVRQQAELNGVPIIVVNQDTPSTLEAIEQFLPRVRFSQEKKLGRLEELLQQHLDWGALGQRLHLA